MPLRPESRITRSPGPVETTVGTEIVLMSLTAGECIGLGETGSDVWRLLATPTTFADLTATLRQQYDAPAGVLEDDVTELLEDMQTRHLVEIQ